jgi:general secretion pathway protein L
MNALRLKGTWKSAVVDSVVSLQFAPDDEASSALKRLRISPQDTIVSSFGANELFCRVVRVPFSDLKKIEQAAPLEAEETLPLPMEQTVGDVQLIESSSGQAKALYTAVPIKTVEKRLELFAASGTTIDLLDADPLALATLVQKTLKPGNNAWAVNLGTDLVQAVLVTPLGAIYFTALASTDNTELLVREFLRHLNLYAEQGHDAEFIYLCGTRATEALCAHWSESLGRRVELLPYPAGVGSPPADAPPWPQWAVELGLGLRELTADRAHRVNLLTGPFSPHKGITAWTGKAVTVGIYALLLFIVWGIGAGIETTGKANRVAAVKASIREIFVSALPDVKNINDEVAQMRSRVAGLEERAKSLGSLLVKEVSPLSVLRHVSQEIPGNIEVEFREFIAEEDRVRIEGITTSFDAIDKIQGRLQAYPWFRTVTVSDAKSGIDPGKVIFKLTIELGSPEV